MIVLSVLIALAPLAAPASSASQAVADALAVPGAKAELLDLRISSGAACPATRAEALHAVSGSGLVPLRLVGTGPEGRPCESFGWARVRVTAAGLVLSHAVAYGEPLQGAVVPGDVELRTGRPPPLAEIPAGGRAARALAGGAPVLAGDVQEGPLPGEPITVVIRAGALEISQAGRALPCARGRCGALLPGGRRVEGKLEHGQLVLETP
jgi:hypothetical protein